MMKRRFIVIVITLTSLTNVTKMQNDLGKQHFGSSLTTMMQALKDLQTKGDLLATEIQKQKQTLDMLNMNIRSSNKKLMKTENDVKLKELQLTDMETKIIKSEKYLKKLETLTENNEKIMKDEADKLKLQIESMKNDKTKIHNHLEEIKDQFSKASDAFKIVNKQKLDAEKDLKEAQQALSDITGNNPANFRTLQNFVDIEAALNSKRIELSELESKILQQEELFKKNKLQGGSNSGSVRLGAAVLAISLVLNVAAGAHFLISTPSYSHKRFDKRVFQKNSGESKDNDFEDFSASDLEPDELYDLLTDIVYEDDYRQQPTVENYLKDERLVKNSQNFNFFKNIGDDSFFYGPDLNLPRTF